MKEFLIHQIAAKDFLKSKQIQNNKLAMISSPVRNKRFRIGVGLLKTLYEFVCFFPQLLTPIFFKVNLKQA